MQFLEDSASMVVHILHSGWIQKGSQDQQNQSRTSQARKGSSNPGESNFSRQEILFAKGSEVSQHYVYFIHAVSCFIASAAIAQLQLTLRDFLTTSNILHQASYWTETFLNQQKDFTVRNSNRNLKLAISTTQSSQMK